MEGAKRSNRVPSEEVDEGLQLLVAVAYAFGQPVPDYEPEFLHVRDRLSAYQMPANGA